MAPGEGAVRLDRNENPYAWSRAVLEAALDRAAAAGLHRYPTAVGDLLTALAAYAGVAPEEVVPGAGSDENIQGAILALTDPGGAVVAPEPTFTMYAVMALRLGRRYIAVPSGPSLVPSAESLLESADRASPSDPALIFVPRPDNPTGQVWPEAFVERLLRGRHWVAVDEAYAEFSTCGLLPQSVRKPRLVILRTLSKAFALAGARVGYAVAQARVAARLRDVALPHNVNTFSLYCALEALARADEAARRRQLIVAEREYLREELARRPGLHPLPGEANFLLVRVDARAAGRSAAELAAGLAERGVLVRRWDTPSLRAHFRVTAGTRDDSRAFLGAIDDVLNGSGGRRSP